MSKIKSVVERSYFLLWVMLSVVFLMVFSKNSPLYPTNDWVDANAFFTMGKGMMNGLVPYRDLFEQKGPLLYFIYGTAYLINHSKFLGVYLFECIAMTVNLIYCYKLMSLYLKKTIAVFLTIFFPVLILNSSFFKQGGSAEEFVIPFLMILIYTVASVTIKNEETLLFSKKQFFWQGFSVSVVFLIKFTMLGPWIGFYIFLSIYYILKKNINIVNLIIYSAIGFLVGLLPWLLYFFSNEALNDFFEVYILINTGAYNKSHHLLAVLFVIVSQLGKYTRTLLGNLLILPGLVSIIVTSIFSRKVIYRWFILSLFIGGLIFVYLGMREYEYYFLFFMPFGVFGYIILGKILESLPQTLNKYVSVSQKGLLFYAGLCSFIMLVHYNQNFRNSLFFYDNQTITSNPSEPSESAMQLFAKYMNEKYENPTLLNFMFLDGGFYLAADIMPTEKHFEFQNIDPNKYPNNYYGQLEAIEEKRVDFIVNETEPAAQLKTGTAAKLISQNYNLVMSHDQYRDGRNHTYWLYERKP